jgi:hypothetical protein
MRALPAALRAHAPWVRSLSVLDGAFAWTAGAPELVHPRSRPMRALPAALRAHAPWVRSLSALDGAFAWTAGAPEGSSSHRAVRFVVIA